MRAKSWLRASMVWLVGTAVFAARADEHVSYNHTVLDCVEEGCFLLKEKAKSDCPIKVEIKNIQSQEPTKNSSETQSESDDEPRSEPCSKRNRKESNASNECNISCVWANPLTWAAIINLILTFFLVFANLGLYRVARRQADAALQANQTTREIASASVRVASFKIGLTQEKSRYYPVIEIEADNSGSVLAKDVLISIRIGFYIRGEMVYPRGEYFHEQLLEAIPAGRSSSARLTLIDFYLEQDTFERMINSKHVIQAEGRLSYRDAFGEKDPEIFVFARFSGEGGGIFEMADADRFPRPIGLR